VILKKYIKINPKATNSGLVSKEIQSILNWFIFFIVFPSVNILGNSITFYIFIYLLFKLGTFWNKKYSGKQILVLFAIAILISTITGANIYMERHLGIGHSLQTLVQFMYWIFAAAFFSFYFFKINRVELSKWVFYGIIANSIGFYVLPLQLDLGSLVIETSLTRNAFVFTLLATMPVSFYYLFNKYKGTQLLLFLPIYLLNIVLTNGRSGAIIGFIEILFIAAVIYPVFNKTLKVLLLPLIGLIYFMQTDAAQIYLDSVANKIEPVAPRLSRMMRSEGDGDLNADKSWLHRKLMIDKAFEISADYPLFGIGPNNFKYFDSKMKTYWQYDRLTNMSLDYYNKRSAHNSYVQLIAETGFTGFLLFLVIILTPLYYLFRTILTKNISVSQLPLIATLGMALHFYAISALTGALPWVVLGISWSIIGTIKNKI
jgi:O-antigen ligase